MVIRRLESLEELTPAWDALAADAVSPMQTARWAACAARAFAHLQHLELLVLGSAAEPRVVAPLARRRVGSLGRLELLGAHELGEPTELVHRSREDLEEFAEAFYALGVPLFIKRIRADSPTIGAFTPTSRARGWVFERPAGATPWISLEDGAKAPEDRFDSGRRSDLRRARRKAEALGPVEIEVGAPEATRLVSLLDEAFRVEASGWKGREGSALAQDRRRGAFIRDYATTASHLGALRIGLLRIGGHAAAMLIGVVTDHRLWVLKMGYDEAFKACSPGVLLLLETVRHAMDAGLTAVELLGFEEPWTKLWTREARRCVALRVYPARARGLVTLAADAARVGTVRLGQRVRTWL